MKFERGRSVSKSLLNVNLFVSLLDVTGEDVH